MISLLLPTRSRPDSMRRFVEHSFGSAFSPSQVQVVFYVDNDDQPSRAVVGELMREHPAPAVAYVCGPRRVMSDYWNHCAAVAEGDILGLMGDDIVIRTAAWDHIVESEFDRWPDRLVYVHGRDGLHDFALGTHGFLHRRWVDTVGHFTPTQFSCDYADAWINEVANALGRRVFLPELYTEHVHPAAGKGEFDDLHRERMARGQRDNVAQVYADTAPDREREVEILRPLLGTPA